MAFDDDEQMFPTEYALARLGNSGEQIYKSRLNFCNILWGLVHRNKLTIVSTQENEVWFYTLTL